MSKKPSKIPPPLASKEKKTSPYDIAICRAGKSGCIHALINPKTISEKIEKTLDELCLREHIMSRVKKRLLYHMRFKVALAGCPNCCPQPQIKDFGISGQAIPAVTENPCIECMKCVKVCKEDGAILIEDTVPVFDYDLCVFCGDCERVCPTGTIENKKVKMRVMAGGRLGRHPQLAEALEEMADEDGVLEVLKEVVEKYIREAPPFRKRRY
jgi:dissimilatory sulfite reductase (desulfoviridin) alpha/beta subunit